ncbi:MAG: hypothetical protein NVS3B16_02190 [Vulcanimicrobiaceae bacterium]
MREPHPGDSQRAAKCVRRSQPPEFTTLVQRLQLRPPSPLEKAAPAAAPRREEGGKPHVTAKPTT